MSDFAKNILVGIFVIAAIIIFASLILFLKPKVGDGKEILEVRFSNISGINIGTQVTIAGKPVGEVIEIDVVKDAREEPSDEMGRVFFYQLKLRVDSSVKVYSSDEIAIRTTGLLGEKSIAIIPKAPKKGEVPKLVNREIVYASSVDPIENTLHNISSLTEKMEMAIVDFDQWFVENENELSRSIKSFADTMEQAKDLLATTNDQKVVYSLKDAITLFSDNMSLIKGSLEEFKQNEIIPKVGYILDNFASTSDYLSQDGKEIAKNIRVITDDLAEGKGLLGKLIKKDDLYLQVSSLLSKADTLMNDINHYGLLFQYDKHWQRTRTKRATLLNSLKSPKEFQSYFDSELSCITTSLSRLSILIEKASGDKEREKIQESDRFKKDFSLLMKQVESLLNSLKLYNEGLAEEKCEK